MPQLDCQTQASTFQSVAGILEVEADILRSRTRPLDKTKFELKNFYDHDCLLPMLCQMAGRELPDTLPGSTCWFHATRVANPDELRRELRPLKSQLDHTWKSLFSLVDNELTLQQWHAFRVEFEADHYGQSEMVIESWLANGGPCGFLLAGQALNPASRRDHPYLEISELVDFIARSVKQKFGIPLNERHFHATHPCLIKFTTDGIRKIDLACAVAYLDHLENWSEPTDFRGNTISLRGEPVPPESIEDTIRVVPQGRHWRFV